MKKLIVVLLLLSAVIPFCSCSEDKAEEPMLIIKFQFDENQARLNNLGQPATIPAGNAAQTPVFNTISSHYIEMAPNANTQIGQGTILYHAPETNIGGSDAGPVSLL